MRLADITYTNELQQLAKENLTCGEICENSCHLAQIQKSGAFNAKAASKLASSKHYFIQPLALLDTKC